MFYLWLMGRVIGNNFDSRYPKNDSCHLWSINASGFRGGFEARMVNGKSDDNRLHWPKGPV